MEPFKMFPAMMYHPVLDSRIVNNEAEKAIAEAEGYGEKPYPAPEPKPAVARVDALEALEERLAKLESIVSELQSRPRGRQPKE